MHSGNRGRGFCLQLNIDETDAWLIATSKVPIAVAPPVQTQLLKAYSVVLLCSSVSEAMLQSSVRQSGEKLHKMHGSKDCIVCVEEPPIKKCCRCSKMQLLKVCPHRGDRPKVLGLLDAQGVALN